MTVEPIENGDGDPTKEEEAPKKGIRVFKTSILTINPAQRINCHQNTGIIHFSANGILLVIATESPKATPIPHRGGGVISPRTRPWSESSEVEPQSNGLIPSIKNDEKGCLQPFSGNPHFDLGSSYLELDDNNLSLLPENDYQSTYSINNDYPGLKKYSWIPKMIHGIMSI
jgi:hypothetical protein